MRRHIANYKRIASEIVHLFVSDCRPILITIYHKIGMTLIMTSKCLVKNSMNELHLHATNFNPDIDEDIFLQRIREARIDSRLIVCHRPDYFSLLFLLQ